MQYRKFGHTDLLVSEIGFGAWAIGGGAMIGQTAIGWGEAKDELSREAIYAALDQGINFFDTADIYGLGHSESLLGQTLATHPEVYLATKGGNVSRQGQFTVDYTKAHLLAACEASLKRLRREVIDYYQLHTARMPHLMQGECIEAMQLLQQQGKIRYWGLSLNTFEPEEEASYLMQHQLGSGFQLVLNLINQKALTVLREASRKGYGIIARMPLQFGLLTGKFDAAASFPDNDHRKNRLTHTVISQAQERLAPVWALCAKYHCAKTALALSYVLSYPEVSVVIPGLRTAGQVQENTKGLFTLEAEELQLIEGLGQQEMKALMELIRLQG